MMKGKLYIRTTFRNWREFLPRLDDGISEANQLKLHTSLTNILPARSTVISSFDEVKVFCEHNIDGRKEFEIVKLIASTLEWEEVELYELPGKQFLRRLSVPRPPEVLKIRVQKMPITDSFRKYYWGKPTKYFPGLPDRVMIRLEKPVDPKWYDNSLSSNLEQMLRKIMAIPGTRLVMLSPNGDLLDVFKRDQYDAEEVYPQVEMTIRQTLDNKEVQFVEE